MQNRKQQGGGARGGGRWLESLLLAPVATTTLNEGPAGEPNKTQSPRTLDSGGTYEMLHRSLLRRPQRPAATAERLPLCESFPGARGNVAVVTLLFVKH